MFNTRTPRSRIASNYTTDIQRTLHLPRVQNRMREGMRQIANETYELSKNQEYKREEQYSVMIQRSQVLFNLEEDQLDQTFHTNPARFQQFSHSPILNQRNQVLKNFKSSKQRNSDLVSLKLVKDHYKDKFNEIIPAHQTLEKFKMPSRSYKYKRYKVNQEEYEKRLRLQHTLQSLQYSSQPQMQQRQELFNQTVTLIVIDQLNDNDSLQQAMIGIKLKQYFLSTIRKNLQPFLDEDIARIAIPLISSIKQKKIENLKINDGTKSRCETIKTKQEFMDLINTLKNQGFSDSLDDVIRFFFIPNYTYRQQLVNDLLHHINNTLQLNDLQNNPQINNICTVRGEKIEDYIQIPWDVKVLFAYSSSSILMEKAHMIEKLLNHLKEKLDINFQDFSPVPSPKRLTLNQSLKKALLLIKEDKDKFYSGEKNPKSPINIFLDRLKVQSLEPPKSELGRLKASKTINLMSQVMNVVKSSKPLTIGSDGQLSLTPLEKQILAKQYPGLTEDDIRKIRQEFRSLIFQNEYFQVKQGIDKVEKAAMTDKTYLGLVLENLKKLSRESYLKVFKAADVVLEKNPGHSIIDWQTFLKISALLDCKISESAMCQFLKHYFDPQNVRWLKLYELDDTLNKIPPPQFPATFRYLFLSLVKNWFKDMGFYRENDDFDCHNFANATNTTILRYIVQWIVGYYDYQQFK